MTRRTDMRRILEWRSDTSCDLAGVTLRVVRANESHRNLVLATWNKSAIAKLRKLTAGLRQRTTLDSLSEAVERLETAGNTFCLTSEDGYTIHAWVSGVQGKLYYVYVRPEIRGHGVGVELSEKMFGPNLRHAFPWPTKDQPDGWTFDPTLAAGAK